MFVSAEHGFHTCVSIPIKLRTHFLQILMNVLKAVIVVTPMLTALTLLVVTTANVESATMGLEIPAVSSQLHVVLLCISCATINIAIII